MTSKPIGVLSQFPADGIVRRILRSNHNYFVRLVVAGANLVREKNIAAGCQHNRTTKIADHRDLQARPSRRHRQKDTLHPTTITAGATHYYIFYRTEIE